MKKRFFAMIQFPSGNLLPVKAIDTSIASWDTEHEAKTELRTLPYYGRYAIFIFDIEKGWVF